MMKPVYLIVFYLFFLTPSQAHSVAEDMFQICVKKNSNPLKALECLEAHAQDFEQKLLRLKEHSLEQSKGFEKEWGESADSYKKTSDSNTAFRLYLEAECARQINGISSVTVLREVYSSCLINLIHHRIKLLGH